MWEEYLFPTSVNDALEILRSYRGQARIIAGGTDLVPELKQHTRKVKCLVDITRIKGLSEINEESDFIKIGAGVTHTAVALSKLIRQQAIVLAEAAFSVGSPLIRNQGTIAGNVINAQPAADTAVALFALEADAEITGTNGTRIVPVEALYEGVGISKVNSTAEILTTILFKKLRKGQGSAFVRLAQRKALALPMLNVAAVVTVENGHIKEAKIVVAPIAPLPFRAKKAETALKGAPINLDSIKEAAEMVALEAQPRDSALRGSSQYRREMVKVLVKRAIEQAIERAC